MNFILGYPGRKICIQEELKFELQHSIARFSNKAKGCKKFINVLIQVSGRQEEIQVSVLYCIK